MINTVAKTGDLLLLSQHTLYVFDRIGAGGADRFQDAEHRLVRTPMERPFQGANGGRDCRMHI